SKSRPGKRRAHDRLDAPAVGPCPNCGEPRLAHRVCLKCGFYRGRPVIEVKEEA
ncbi:MAG TPA: 50S ribosomal protein L32, partial [Blastocatellia bacterium]|nr:50S ribosomal protein L32 [Blastocatellia bacterium]